MSKIVLPTVASADRLTTINDNFQKVEDALNSNVLYRDNIPGEPNSMSDDLDMNGRRVYNLPVPTLTHEAARLVDVQNAITGSKTANLVTVTPAGTISSTNVQGALQELDVDIQGHINDTAGAHSSSAIDFIAVGTGAVATTTQAALRRTPSVDDFGADPTGVADSTTAIKTALQSGKTRIEAVGTYKVTSVDATITEHLTFLAHGATFVNTSQVATLGLPILRIRGTSSLDVSVLGLTVTGPRLTASTTVGTGVYATNGYPSGIDIYTARKATVEGCSVSGTFFAGIEAHYCAEFRASDNTVNNHGYAGMVWSDCVLSIIDGNRADDVGSVMITDGYGFTSATSYNSPAAGYNETVIITNNRATRCKRKAFDAHSGLSVLMANNHAKGFGNAGYYAVCEGVDKQVRSVRMIGNIVEGDTSFVATSSGGAFEVGVFGSVLTQTPSFTIEDNEVINVSVPYAFICSNGATAGFDVKQFKVHGNTVTGSTFTYAVGTNNYTPGVYKSIDISDNDFIGCTASAGWMLLRYYNTLRVLNNTHEGLTGSTFFNVDSYTKALIERNTSDGVLVGAAQLEKYSDGLLIETTQTFGGAVTNLDILSCNLGAANDNTCVVEVSVTEMRSGTSGLVTYAATVYGTRTGAAAAVFTPTVATNMTVVATAYGAATAPKLIWTVVGNIGTLQFQPQDTFAAYIIKVRATSWRGVLSPLVR